MQNNGSGQPLRIVQFTDTHFFGASEGRLMGVDTSDTFRQVLHLSLEQRGTPDLYLLTGDLSQDETGESYRRLARALTVLEAPAYFLPGNHDKRGVMHDAFEQSPADIRPDKVIVSGDWLIVMLDTLVENEVGGRLEQDQLDLLDEALQANPDKHALVCMHHHPVPVGAAWLDGICVENSEDFWRVADRHENLRAVLWGHIHQQFDGMRNQVKLMASPSTCVQFEPRTEDFSLDRAAPGYRWLELRNDGTVQSSVERVKELAAGLDYQSEGY